jgi:hypothetical protein
MTIMNDELHGIKVTDACPYPILGHSSSSPEKSERYKTLQEGYILPLKI